MTTDLDIVTGEIVPASGGIVRAAGSVQDLIDAQAEYRALCHALCDENDYQAVGGKQFRKKSGWRKLAVAFNVSTELRSEEYEKDDNGQVIRATMVVRATAPNGRFMDGIGACSIHERGFSKPTHDIPATAMTRATNRACADLFGLGEVSAEELSAGDMGDWSATPQPVRQAAPRPAPRPSQSSGGDVEKKRKQVYAMCKQADVTVFGYCGNIVGKTIRHTNELDVAECDEIIAALKHLGI
jgi:hypothetical protein